MNDVIKITELEETQNIGNVWFLVSEGDTVSVSKKIKGSNVGGASKIDPTKTLYVDENYAGGASTGSIAAPFTNIQASLDRIPAAGTGWAVIVLCKLTGNKSVNINKEVYLISLVPYNPISGLNMDTSKSVTLSGFSLPTTMVQQRDYRLSFLDCEFSGNFDTNAPGSFFADNIVLSSAAGRLRFTTPGDVSIYNSRQLSIVSASNLDIYVESCSFKNTIEGIGLSLSGHSSAAFKSCVFAERVTEAGASIIKPVNVAITKQKAYFIDCQINEYIANNDNCVISDSYIRYVPKNYVIESSKAVDHITGIDTALGNTTAPSYITRDLTSSDYAPDNQAKPTLANVWAIKSGKFVTLKYRFYIPSFTSVNSLLTFRAPAELGELTDEYWWGVGSRQTTTETLPVVAGYTKTAGVDGYYRFVVVTKSTTGSDSGQNIYVEITAMLK